MVEHGPSEAAIEAAADAYFFGVYPGDESEATDEEVKKMAFDVLAAAHDPALGPDRSVCLREVMAFFGVWAEEATAHEIRGALLERFTEPVARRGQQ